MGVKRTPGHVKFLSSQRSELSNIDRIITLIESLCQFYHVPYRTVSMKIGCDNMSTLRIFDEEYIFSPNDTDLDYFSSIRARIKGSLINWTSEWVKGHQDNTKQLSSLTRMEILNIEMDKLAKTFWAKGSSNINFFPQYDSLLCSEKWSFCLNGVKWPHANCRLLYNAIMHPQSISRRESNS